MEKKSSLLPEASPTVDNERGQGLTEYLILLLLISVVSIAAAKSLGGTIKQKLQEARTHINSDITIHE